MGRFDEEAAANAKAIEFEIETLSAGHWDLFKRQHRRSSIAKLA